MGPDGIPTLHPFVIPKGLKLWLKSRHVDAYPLTAGAHVRQEPEIRYRFHNRHAAVAGIDVGGPRRSAAGLRKRIVCCGLESGD